MAVTRTDQTSWVILSIEMFLGCMFKIVEIKLMALKTKDTLAIRNKNNI